jgi:hypothetical protein
MKAVLTLVALSVLLGACNEVNFVAASAPPPGRVASIDDAHGTIRLSGNVALAVECTGRSASTGTGPCRDVAVTIADDTVIEVYPADVARLVEHYTDGEVVMEEPSVFVVVGKAPGTTSVRFDTNKGSAEFMATVAP